MAGLVSKSRAAWSEGSITRWASDAQRQRETDRETECARAREREREREREGT